MKNFIALLVAAVFIQVCTSAMQEDAEHKIKELRELTTKKQDEAFLKHSQMSNEIDEVAVKTKTRGREEIEAKFRKVLAKLSADQALTKRCRGTRSNIFEQIKDSHVDELIQCVDQTGSKSVKVLSDQRMTLVGYIWKAIYEEEKHIIVCGRDRRCLDAAIADVRDKIEEVAKVIQDEVTISDHNKEVQIQSIKGCASKVIASAEQAFGKVPTCTFV